MEVDKSHSHIAAKGLEIGTDAYEETKKNYASCAGGHLEWVGSNR